MKAVSVGLHARARHGRRRCDGAGGRARFPPTVQRGGPHCPRWQRSAGWSWSWGASLQAATMAAVTPARPELRPHDRPCFSRGAPCPMPASHPPRRLLPASAPLGGPCSPRTSVRGGVTRQGVVLTYLLSLLARKSENTRLNTFPTSSHGIAGARPSGPAKLQSIPSVLACGTRPPNG